MAEEQLGQRKAYVIGELLVGKLDGAIRMVTIGGDFQLTMPLAEARKLSEKLQALLNMADDAEEAPKRKPRRS